MDKAVELFEQFLNKERKLNFAYHQHNLGELIVERDLVNIDISHNEQAYKEAKTEEEATRLQEEYTNLTSKRERMNNVLFFAGGATKGWLISKTAGGLKWEYQEPLYFTDNTEIAEKAFWFFNTFSFMGEHLHDIVASMMDNMAARKPPPALNLTTQKDALKEHFETADPATFSGGGGPLAIIVAASAHNGKTMISAAIEQFLCNHGFTNVTVHEPEDNPEVRHEHADNVLMARERPEFERFLAKPIKIFEVNVARASKPVNGE